VLSVGNLDVAVKRMDYVVREVAALATRPCLVMLGQQDRETPEVARLAESLLGAGGYQLRTVRREDVWSYYFAADVFALASLQEGFGLVYVEALAAGLPVIAHDFPVARHVLGEQGSFADLTQPGALAAALCAALGTQRDPVAASRRREFVEANYDWSAVGEQYIEMLLVTGARARAPSAAPTSNAAMYR
jgi:glycosyltransferase involved in cell wall biosynthesis